MINLVFYNSYQNSYVGFQASQYMVGSSKLTTDNKDYSKYADTSGLLTNSGCTCAIGKSQNGNINYFVYRGLNISDSKGREWYINLGIEADGESKEQFQRIITNLLLDFSSFEKNLKSWFIATPDNSFSYDLNFDHIDEYILRASQISIDKIEFYALDNPYTSKFRKMVSDITNDGINALLLLVPETTLSYFNKQNPFFQNIEKHYVFNADIFKGLVRHDKELLATQENVRIKAGPSPKDEKQYTTTHDDPIGEFIEENKHTIELACKIAIGTLAVVGAGVLIKKIFF